MSICSTLVSFFSRNIILLHNIESLTWRRKAQILIMMFLQSLPVLDQLSAFWHGKVTIKNEQLSIGMAVHGGGGVTIPERV